MTLLEFARGPAMQWSLTIFAIGVLWRLVGSFLLLRTRDLSKAKGTAYVKAGARAMIMRSIPPHELEKNITFQHITGYAWHLGFFAVLLLFGPHVPFFKQFLGFGWPTLPNIVVLVWFPFSKLMHMFYAFPARYQVGAAMEHKGVKA